MHTYYIEIPLELESEICLIPLDQFIAIAIFPCQKKKKNIACPLSMGPYVNWQAL